MLTGQTDRRMDRRETVTVRFPLDAPSVIKLQLFRYICGMKDQRLLLGFEANIGISLGRNLAVFARSAITPPTANRFG